MNKKYYIAFVIFVLLIICFFFSQQNKQQALVTYSNDCAMYRTTQPLTNDQFVSRCNSYCCNKSSCFKRLILMGIVPNDPTFNDKLKSCCDNETDCQSSCVSQYPDYLSSRRSS
jgi:hypothetical protein